MGALRLATEVRGFPDPTPDLARSFSPEEYHNNNGMDLGYNNTCSTCRLTEKILNYRAKDLSEKGATPFDSRPIALTREHKETVRRRRNLILAFASKATKKVGRNVIRTLRTYVAALEFSKGTTQVDDRGAVLPVLCHSFSRSLNYATETRSQGAR